MKWIAYFGYGSQSVTPPSPNDDFAYSVTPPSGFTMLIFTHISILSLNYETLDRRHRQYS
jgi:hypothetical protein